MEYNSTILTSKYELYLPSEEILLGEIKEVINLIQIKAISRNKLMNIGRECVGENNMISMSDLIALLIGIGLVLLGFFDWLHFRRVVQQGNSTEAIVIKFYDGDVNGNSYPVFRYYVEGTEYVRKVRYSSSNAKTISQQNCVSEDDYYLGKRMKISCDIKSLLTLLLKVKVLLDAKRLYSEEP